jgi:hypothetical protein
MCQNSGPGAGHASPELFGDKGEVIVLDEDRRRRIRELGGDRLREARIHVLVFIPVAGSKDRPDVGDVTHRPQPFVGEAAVVAFLLLGRQPDALERVRRRIRRNHDPIPVVDDQAIGVPGAVRDPGAAALAHQRIESNRHASSRRGRRDGTIRLSGVHVRLAIGHHEQRGTVGASPTIITRGHTVISRQGCCQRRA